MTDRGGGRNTVYFEFTVIGAQVRVAAIDAASGVEVSIVGAVGVPRHDLERVALRKLMKRLEKDP
ncbi:hypothetical protein ABB55_24210 [Prosthecomicrobium hirschii]|uniref:DUF6898 domain-containing protein n=1 Tax=Prosthecodimorpha hirschii TaxID=665126 RepID=A0A0P6WJJ8_9HYPH|nr:hypothetical protein [Prosthecomicrobium hirschii]KPL54946.1 hypothetical protein ABB55_24210 [Prosthecomicrobium hirschii]